MWQFLCGFGAGVYIGTYFECKPTIEQIVSFAKTKIPEKQLNLDIHTKQLIQLIKNLKLNILHVNDIVNGIKILTISIKKSGDYFIKSRNQFDLFKVIKIFNSKTARKVKLLWLNKKTTTINNIRIKTIPGWKQKINVIDYFYNDLNENN